MTLKAFREQFENFQQEQQQERTKKLTNKQQQQQNYQPFVRGVARCGLQSTLKCSSTSASFLSSLASWKAARKGSSLESETYASLARPRYAFNRKLATRSWSNFIRFRHSIQLQSNLSGCKKRLVEIQFIIYFLLGWLLACQCVKLVDWLANCWWVKLVDWL